MEIERLEADLIFLRAKENESVGITELLRADLRKLENEGSESEKGLLKIALYDEIERQGDRRKGIADLERRISVLRLSPAQLIQSNGYGRLSFDCDKSAVDDFCPFIEKSVKQAQLTAPKTHRQSRTSAAGQDVTEAQKTTADREKINEIKINALERNIEILLTVLETSKSQEAQIPVQRATQSVVRGIKPHRFKSGDDICTFLERFEQYVIVNNIRDGNLDLLLLSLIDDDKTYKKMRNIDLSAHQRANIRMLIDTLKVNLFPVTETRILRSELARLTQNSGESVEDFALRVEDLALKAYSDLRLREEACVSRLMEGTKSGVVRQKLMESDVETFDKAKLIAIKQERITETITAQEDIKPLIDLDTPVYIVDEVKTVEHSDKEQKSSSCVKCGKSDHGVETCWQNVMCQLCGVKGHVASVCRSGGPLNSTSRGFLVNEDCCLGCGGRGHVRSQCPTIRDLNRSSSRASDFDQPRITRGFQKPHRRVICYECNLQGHYRNQCPGLQQFSRVNSGRSAGNFQREQSPKTFEQRTSQRDYLN